MPPPIRRSRPVSDYKRKKHGESDFQSFLLKEKEFQLNVMNNLNLSDSIHDSMRKSHLGASHFSSGGPSPSYYPSGDRRLRVADSVGSESSGSLKYISKNLNS